LPTFSVSGHESHGFPNTRRTTPVRIDTLIDTVGLRLGYRTVEPATVTVIPPNGDPLDATDSRYVLTHLVEWVAGLPDDTLDQARTLVSTTPHLGDLLQLLPSEPGAAGGEARIDDLPHVYWAALDFALSRERDAPDQIETVEEARRVAEIAEGLDR